MNAEDSLSQIVRAFHKANFEAVLVGNAAAALQGAPVTTLDFDFFYRDTEMNEVKIEQIRKSLSAYWFPANDLTRIKRLINEENNLVIDLLPDVIGVKSFAGVRARSTELKFEVGTLLVASLNDVIASKTAANRPKDLAVLDILRETQYEIEESKKRT